MPTIPWIRTAVSVGAESWRVPFSLSLIWLTSLMASAQGTSLALRPPVSTLFHVFLSALVRSMRSRLSRQRAVAGLVAGEKLMATDPNPSIMRRMQATRMTVGGRPTVSGASWSVIGEKVLGPARVHGGLVDTVT